ncbi:A-kinase anchor protein 4-like [Heteronotia binoei]|uniref:A-kinase anchor protein 4-like n=1 Tax=Heteronotia binoei TaxID=13085 RepID=UPI00292E2FA9|nr:A-kinase anchor protein 4-like [Heteronotia binoei]
MTQEIDWLRSGAAVCKVNHYSPEGQKDQDRKMICFVDVCSLNVKDKDRRGFNELDLGSLEEKEVIVIKDNEKNNPNNTEGAVCLFKQGSTEELNIVSWLSNDLQKYAIGFQHALSPATGSRKTNAYTLASEKLPSSSSSGQRVSQESGTSSYVTKLCSLVVQKARQEIQNKLESSSSKTTRHPVPSSEKVPTTGSYDGGSEKPWSLDVHAKDIFGMALKLIQQHLIEKTKEASHEPHATSSSYAHRDSNYDRPGGSPSSKCPPGTGGLQEPSRHESPKASISGIILSLVQKVLRDAASNLDDSASDANRAYKQASTS